MKAEFMKLILVVLSLLVTKLTFAGGGTGFRNDQIIFTCNNITPLLEGQGGASLRIENDKVFMTFANFVMDFNVSFTPVKEIVSVHEEAGLSVENEYLVIESTMSDYQIVIKTADLLLKTSVMADLRFNRQSLNATCSAINIHWLRQAMKL